MVKPLNGIGAALILSMLSLAIGSLLAGCASPILLDDPSSSDYAKVSVVIGDGERGTTLLRPTIKVISIREENGSHHSHYDSSIIYISSVYLRPGTYVLSGACRRNWVSQPTAGSTYTLPYGLSADDASEIFTITVEANKHYSLDCVPGISKSEFVLKDFVG